MAYGIRRLTLTPSSDDCRARNNTADQRFRLTALTLPSFLWLYKTVVDSQLKLTSLTRAVVDKVLSAFVPSILFRRNPQR